MLILVFDTPEEKNKFIFLYETYGKMVYYTLGLYGLDEQTKEDLSQDIYIIIARHLHHIDEKAFKKTQNYIITITRNYCKNYLRNKSRKPEDFLEDLPDLQTDSDNLLEHVIKKEQLQRLAAEINQLDDIYKSVLEFKYVNSLSNDEIADILKIKKKTVEMRLYRANRILRAKLKEQEYESCI